MSGVTTIDSPRNPVAAPYLASHGGTDAQGLAPHDFSTNANAAGPCPELQERLRAVDATHYPDFAYVALRAQLAAHEGVQAAQIVLTASASEAITRMTAAVHLLHAGAQVFVPPQAYGDYARAAAAWQMPRSPHPESAQLIWHCEPGSPAGQLGQGLPRLLSTLRETQTLVLDLAYAPLRLDGEDPWLGAHAEPSPQGPAAGGAARAGGRMLRFSGESGLDAEASAARSFTPDAKPAEAASTMVDTAAVDAPADAEYRQLAAQHRSRVWRMVTPNKALGLTGIRAAYLIAPDAACQVGSFAARLLQQLQAMAPSWPVGSHGVCMLQAWCEPDVQAWLLRTKHQLRQWRARQIDRLQCMGWQVQASVVPFFLAQPPVPAGQLPQLLAFLRARGVKLRDASGLGAPGWLRLGVRSPTDQIELEAAWQAWVQHHGRPSP